METIKFPDFPFDEALLEEYRKVESEASEGRYQEAIDILNGMLPRAQEDAACQAVEAALDTTRGQQAKVSDQCAEDYKAGQAANAPLEELRKILELWRTASPTDERMLRNRQSFDAYVTEREYQERSERLDNTVKSASVNIKEIQQAIEEADRLLVSMGVSHSLFSRVEATRNDLTNLLEGVRKAEKVDTALELGEFDEAERILAEWVNAGKLTYTDSAGKSQSVNERLTATYRARADFLKSKAQEYLQNAGRSLKKGLPGNALEHLATGRKHAENVAGDFRAKLNIAEVIQQIEDVLENALEAKRKFDLTMKIRDSIPEKASPRERLAALRRAHDTYPLLEGLEGLIQQTVETVAGQVASEMRGVIASARSMAKGDRKDEKRFERALDELKKADTLKIEVGDSPLLAKVSKDLEEARKSIIEAGQNWAIFLEQKNNIEAALEQKPPATETAEDIFNHIRAEFQNLPELSTLRSQLVVLQKDEPALNQLRLAYLAGDYDLVIQESQVKFAKAPQEILTRSRRLVAAAALARARRQLAESKRNGKYDKALNNLDEMEDACRALSSIAPGKDDVVTEQQVKEEQSEIPTRRERLKRLAEKGRDLQLQLDQVHQLWATEVKFKEASGLLRKLEEAFAAGQEEEQKFLLPKIHAERVSLNNGWREHHFGLVSRFRQRIEQNYALMQELRQANLIRPEDAGREEQVAYRYWKAQAERALNPGVDVPPDYRAARDAYAQIKDFTLTSEEDRKAYRDCWRKALKTQVKGQDPEEAAENLEKEVFSKHELRDDFDLHETVVDLWLKAFRYDRATQFVDQTRRYALLQVQKRADYLAYIIDAHRSFFKPEKSDKPDYIKALSKLSLLLETQAEALNRTEQVRQMVNDWRDSAVNTLLGQANQDELDGRYVDAIYSYGLVLELTPKHDKAMARIRALRTYLDQAADKSLQRGDDICTDNPQAIAVLRRLELFQTLVEEIRDHEAELRRLLGVYKAIRQEKNAKAVSLKSEHELWSKVIDHLVQAEQDVNTALAGGWELDVVSSEFNRAHRLLTNEGKAIIRLNTISSWVNQLKTDIATLDQQLQTLSENYMDDEFEEVPQGIEAIKEQIRKLKMETSNHFQWLDDKIKTQDPYGIPVERGEILRLMPTEVIGLEKHLEIVQEKRKNLQKWEDWLGEIEKHAGDIRIAIRNGRGDADAGSLLEAVLALENVREKKSKAFEIKIEESPHLPESLKAYQTIQTRISQLLQELGESNLEDLQHVQHDELAETCKARLKRWNTQQDWEIEHLLAVTDAENSEQGGSLYARYEKLYGKREQYPPEEVRKGNYARGSLAEKIQNSCRGYQSNKHKIAEVARKKLEEDINQAILCDRLYQPPLDASKINEGKVEPSWWQNVLQRIFG